MQVNSWNAYNNPAMGLPTVNALNNARATNENHEQKVKASLSDSNWNKIREAVVARLPQAQEFARRAFAGAVGAGVSMVGGTVVSLAMGRPNMSVGEIVGYATASGIVSACASDKPSTAFVQGVAIGTVAQFAFTHAKNKTQIVGNEALSVEKNKYDLQAKDLKECQDKYNSLLKEVEVSRQNTENCDKEYQEVVANGKLEECEHLGFAYDKLSLEKKCNLNGFVRPRLFSY